MSQHPDGGECAHLIVESTIIGNNADAIHESLPVFVAGRYAADGEPVPHVVSH